MGNYRGPGCWGLVSLGVLFSPALLTACLMWACCTEQFLYTYMDKMQRSKFTVYINEAEGREKPMTFFDVYARPTSGSAASSS